MDKVRGRPFEPGNKLGRGRPKGSRNKASHQAQLLLDQHAEAITRVCIIAAMKGIPKAMQLCMELIFPARRDPAVRIRLGPTKTASELAAASERVVRSIGSGKITPAEGETITNVLETRRKVIETVEMERRMVNLEAAQEKSEKGSSHGERKK
jgi:hypothetical protein